MVTFRKLGQLGRFGNQLFQYAGTRLYAETNGFSCAFPDWCGTRIFKNIKSYQPIEFLKCAWLPTRQLSDLASNTKIERLKNWLYSYRLPHTITLEELYRQPQNNINFYGYFQTEFSINLLLNHKDRVRQWYTFQDEIEASLQELTKKLRPWVSLHIRRGDWVRLGHSLPLARFTATLKKLRKERKVIICSDDQEIAKELSALGIIQLQNPFAHIPSHIFDFWLVKNAATIIGSGSTFSWWAAYLGGQNDYYAPTTGLWQKNKSQEITKQYL